MKYVHGMCCVHVMCMRAMYAVMCKFKCVMCLVGCGIGTCDVCGICVVCVCCVVSVWCMCVWHLVWCVCTCMCCVCCMWYVCCVVNV